MHFTTKLRIASYLSFRRESSFFNRRGSINSGVFNTLFIKNVSTCDRLQNMVLRISQHCTPCIRSWFELRDCKQSNVFAHLPSFVSLMENVVLSYGQEFQLMVYLEHPIFEYQILPEVLELRPVESQKEPSLLLDVNGRRV